MLLVGLAVRKGSNPPGSTGGAVGTPTYSSLAVLKGNEPVEKDDIESLVLKKHRIFTSPYTLNNILYFRDLSCLHLLIMDPYLGVKLNLNLN